MSEFSVNAGSSERQSLERRRASHRAELQRVFRHERDRIENAVSITEGDLVIACAMRKYPAPVVLFIKDELTRKEMLLGKRPRRLTRDNEVQLKESVRHILLKPEFLDTYSALAEEMAKRFRDPNRPHLSH